MATNSRWIWILLLAAVVGSGFIGAASEEEPGDKIITPVPDPVIVMEKEVMATAGGTATGGPYTMSYTLGQPAVVGISRYSELLKKYDLQHGFWQMWCLNSGDVNADGDLTAGDAQSSFAFVVAFEQPNHEQWCAADCNGDGDITAGDAQSIFYAAVGIGSCNNPVRGNNFRQRITRKIAPTADNRISSNQFGYIWLEQSATSDELSVKIMIDTPTQSIDAFTIDISYDPEEYVYSSWSKGELDPGWEMIDVGIIAPGILRCLAFSVSSQIPENESGSIMEIVFTRNSTTIGSHEQTIGIVRTFDDLKNFVIE